MLGPPRITFTITHGVSAMQAYPRFSCIREKPGPLVAVIDFTPARDAPITAPMLAISSSIWMKRAAQRGKLHGICSLISDGGRDGVSGKETAARGKAPFGKRLVALEKQESFRLCSVGS